MKSLLIYLIPIALISSCAPSGDEGLQQRLTALEQRVQQLEAQRSTEKEAPPSSPTLEGAYSGPAAGGQLTVSFDSPGVATFNWPAGYSEVASYQLKPNGILFDFKKYQFFMQRSGDTLSGTLNGAAFTIHKR